MWHGWGVGVWPFFGFLWFLFVAFIIFGVVRWVVWGRRWGGHGCGYGGYGRGYGPMGPHFDAEAILRERLARGEIDDKEYERLLGILKR